MRIHRVEEEVDDVIPAGRRARRRRRSGKGNAVIRDLRHLTGAFTWNNAVRAFIFLLIFIGTFLLLEMISYAVFPAQYAACEASVKASASANAINSSCYMESVMFGLSMPLSVLVYLIAYRKMRLGAISKSLGLSWSKLTLGNIGVGLLLFVAVLLVEFTAGIISVAANKQINTNAAAALVGAPIWFYLFVAFIEPINEEVLFRGFLVGRLGIIISALFFAIGHVGYNSTFEIDVIAAFIFGLLAGYVFKKRNSLYPSMMAHMLVNIVAVLAFLH